VNVNAFAPEYDYVRYAPNTNTSYVPVYEDEDYYVYEDEIQNPPRNDQYGENIDSSSECIKPRQI